MVDDDAKSADAGGDDLGDLFAGHTRTLTLLDGQMDVLEAGDVVPWVRQDGLVMRCEVVSVQTLSDGARRVVLWHDLPIMVEEQDRAFRHADGRECLWSPSGTGQWFWIYQSGGEHRACPRDHWLVLLTDYLPTSNG